MNERSRDRSIATQLRPTLVVGLGGTGGEVLVRLKAHLRESYKERAFEVVKLIALDTSSETFSARRRDGGVETLEANEVLNIGNINTREVLRNLDYTYPEIKKWLPRDMPGSAITAGAGQVRPMGRLAFFYHFSRIMRALETQIRSIANLNTRVAANEGAASDAPGIYVYVVSSLVGGTGSGTFLDTAYLLRYLCEQLGTQNVHITGVLVLPQAYANVGGDRIKANAYAALTELDYFSNRTLQSPFSVEYNNSVRLEYAERPFKVCYLVDAVNEAGYAIAGMSELAPMIAESIFVQISSRVGQQATAAIDNFDALNNTYVDQEGLTHPTSFSGFGIASLVFPAKEIMVAAGRRFAARLINQGLLGDTLSRDPENRARERYQEARAGVVEAGLDAFMERSQLRRDLILTTVTRDDQGRQMTPRIEQNGLSQSALESLPPSELLSQFAGRARTFENTVLNTTMRQRFDKNSVDLESALSNELTAEIDRISADPTRGILIVDPFLERLRARLTTVAGELDLSRREKEEQVGRHAQAIDTNRQRLTQALESWMDIGGRKRKQATQQLLNSYATSFAAQFEVMRLTAAIRLLSALITRVDDQRREVSILLDQLQAAWSDFEAADREVSERWAEQFSAREQSITDVHDLEAIYTRYIPDVAQQVTLLTSPSEMGSLIKWRKEFPTYERISSRLLDFAQGAFKGVMDERLEDQIQSQRKRDERTPAVRLLNVRTSALPYWSIQRPRLPEGGALMQTVEVIAVEDKDSSIYRGDAQETGVAITTTLDAHRITVLQTKHGMLISALQRYDEYKQVYDNYRKRHTLPLHAFPIQDPRKAKQMFAVADAFGMITKDGAANFTLTQPDPLMPGTAMGQGIERAVERFSANGEYITRVEGMIDALVRRQGNVEAAKLIDTYLDRAMSVSDKSQRVERELKMLARDYRESYL